ncbi:Undecaprenyl phosphate-alpha-4-amino-4-deoxy-L-arabinose arabinosyl transferase [Streptomyces californicus]
MPIPTDPGYVVHPPVGKWIIGFGEQLFGFTPFGWRFMVAALGTLSVLLLCRIGRRLFRSTFLGCLAGLLLAVDGLHFVMSRTALLDLIVMFFVLAAFGCLVVDRDHARRRLAAALPVDEEGVLRPDARVAETLRLGWRPWRLAAGVMLGLAFATKWNGLYVLAAFGLMTVVWDVGARRTAGAVHPYRAVLRRDLIPAFVSTVPVAIVTYLVSWTGWIVTDKGYYRNWAATEGKGSTWSWLFPDWLRSLWHYENQVYDFHVGLTSGHTYESNPWSWLVLGRPVSYFYEEQTGCPESSTGKCASEVLAIGTPLLWWLACFALAYVVWRWFFRRDWRAGAIACGVAAGWLPWFFYQERDLPLLRGGVRPVPLPRGHDDAGRGHRPGGGHGGQGRPGPHEGRPDRRTPPHPGRDHGGRAGAPGHLELHLLLAAVHGDLDPGGLVAGPDVAGHVGLAGRTAGGR